MKGSSVITEKSKSVGAIIKRYNNRRETVKPPKKIRVLMKGFAFGVLNACLSTLLPIKKQPYKINQEVKKKYETTDAINNTTRIMAINNIMGKDITKNKAIFQGGYSKIFLFEMRESKNRNIKNTKNGKNIIIPINETYGLG
jgi:hypothetical protein